MASASRLMPARADCPSRTIALIGGTGFIGRHVALFLRERGDAVRLVVRPRSAPRSHVPPGVEVREANLDTSDPRLHAALCGVDAVVYAAGTVRGRRLADFIPANVEGLAAVVGSLAAAGAKCPLIVLSSLAASQPQLSHYARSKRMGEGILAGGATDLPWTILRPTAVYGPGDRELRPIFEIMRRGVLPCLAGPQQRLSFIHVADVVEAIVAAIDHPAGVARQTYTLDDGTPGGYDRAALASSLRPGRGMITLRVPRLVLALAARANLGLSRLLGRAPMLTPGKVAELTYHAWLGENGAFTAATGWTPRYDLATGVRSLFEED